MDSSRLTEIDRPIIVQIWTKEKKKEFLYGLKISGSSNQ